VPPSSDGGMTARAGSPDVALGAKADIRRESRKCRE